MSFFFFSFSLFFFLILKEDRKQQQQQQQASIVPFFFSLFIPPHVPFFLYLEKRGLPDITIIIMCSLKSCIVLCVPSLHDFISLFVFLFFPFSLNSSTHTHTHTHTLRCNVILSKTGEKDKKLFLYPRRRSKKHRFYSRILLPFFFF